MASISSLGIGSGLDLNGLLDQLEAAERKQLEPIVAQQQSYEAKISAYGTLEGSLESFKEAVDKLGDPALYQSLSSNVSGEGITASASQAASPGRYDVSVTQLARAQSLASDGFATKDSELGAGTLSLTVGGEDISITLSQEDSTLEGLRDAINDAEAGVSASIIDTGDADNPYRLVLSTSKTGVDASISAMSFTPDAGVTSDLDTKLAFDIATPDPDDTGAGMHQSVAGANAELSVNGIAITSASNTVKDAIEGVELSLTETGDTTVKVEYNNLALREAVSGFVKSYNELKGTMGTLTSFDAETGASGELLGDATLRSIESRLRSTLTGGVAQGEFRSLTDIGITLQLDGTLELDEDRLNEVITTQRNDLASFFTGGEDGVGLADSLDDTLAAILDDGGLLDNATSGLETRMESLERQYERTEKSIDATVSRYRTQFGQLDSMIASMNQTSSYLTQQFDALNAQLNQ
ncbi:flagellar filament capping protein FliD [Halomonas cupida]|uniref:flagellar filament capping protein FliD n=1 Tax=Halomonas TaxID=2745 RepID=UPI001A8EE2D2|nr:flagellar filament capping protein FliD [Halomonas litopenaei]MBN8412623.1 flagellar filament capping protein FliD [Halomonas litopenaei]